MDVSTPGIVQLTKTGAVYTTATGTLESSTFDTGTGVTNYTILSWQPTSQSASTTLEFQVAANNDNATWNYVGPDGTANTYFTTPGQDMGSVLDNSEFFRYKALPGDLGPDQVAGADFGYRKFCDRLLYSGPGYFYRAIRGKL